MTIESAPASQRLRNCNNSELSLSDDTAELRPVRNFFCEPTVENEGLSYIFPNHQGYCSFKAEKIGGLLLWKTTLINNKTQSTTTNGGSGNYAKPIK